MRNNFEEAIDVQLKLSGVEYGYEVEKIPYTIHSSYLPDFVLNLDGHRRYIECKGHFRVEDRRKLAAVKRQYPDIDLRIVFYRIPKLAIQRWCKRNNILWAFQTIPLDWLPMTKTKHPKNKYERMKVNAEKNEKRQDKQRKRKGSNNPVSVSDEDAEE